MVKIEGPVWYTTNQPTNGKRTCMVYFIRKNMSRIFFKHCQARRRRPSPHLNLRPEMRMWILTQWRQNHPFFWGFRYLCQPTHTGDTLSLSLSLSLSPSPPLFIFIYIYIHIKCICTHVPTFYTIFLPGLLRGFAPTAGPKVRLQQWHDAKPIKPISKREQTSGTCRCM